MPGRFDVPDGSDDQRGGYFVYLTPAQRSDQVPLQPPALIGVAHDAPTLQAAPQLESVREHIPARRLKARGLPPPAGLLTRLHHAHLGPFAETQISDAPGGGDAQIPSFQT